MERFVLCWESGRGCEKIRCAGVMEHRIILLKSDVGLTFHIGLVARGQVSVTLPDNYNAFE